MLQGTLLRVSSGWLCLVKGGSEAMFQVRYCGGGCLRHKFLRHLGAGVLYRLGSCGGVACVLIHGGLFQLQGQISAMRSPTILRI